MEGRGGRKLKKKITFASLAFGENSLYAPVYRDRFSQGRLSECSITFNVQRIGFWTIFKEERNILFCTVNQLQSNPVVLALFNLNSRDDLTPQNIQKYAQTYRSWEKKSAIFHNKSLKYKKTTLTVNTVNVKFEPKKDKYFVFDKVLKLYC